MTPLMWSLGGPSVEHGSHESAYQIGALTLRERTVPADSGECTATRSADGSRSGLTTWR